MPKRHYAIGKITLSKFENQPNLTFYVLIFFDAIGKIRTLKIFLARKWTKTFDILKLPMAPKKIRTSKVFFDSFFVLTFYLMFRFLTFWSTSHLFTLLTFWSFDKFLTFDILITLKIDFWRSDPFQIFEVVLDFWRSDFWHSDPFPKIGTQSIKS